MLSLTHYNTYPLLLLCQPHEKKVIPYTGPFLEADFFTPYRIKVLMADRKEKEKTNIASLTLNN
jgi:hypothetical protein